ncbi:MAG: PAS domain S-box protein [Acidobacteriota bacterium]
MKDEKKSKAQLLDELQTLRNQLNQLQSATSATVSSASQDEGEINPTKETLRQSEAALRSLYDSASMMMGVVELLGNDVLHISVNQATADFFGTTREAIIGKLASQLGATTELADIWIAAYKESERAGEPLRFEYELAGRKGTRILAATVSHIGKTGEGHSRFCYIIEDITERKRIREAIRENEAGYRHLVNNAGDIIYKADAAGNIILFNPTATRILGYTEEELLGRHYLALCHPDFREAGERFYSRQFIKRIPETYYEFPAIAKDGTTVWLEQNVRLVTDGKQVISFDAVARDVTQRKVAEEATRRAEAKVRTLVENARDVIARFDRDRRYLYVNPAIKLYTLLEPETFIGNRFGDSGFPPSQLVLWNQAHQKVCETGKHAEVEFTYLRAEENIHCQAYMVPEFAADGTVESVLVVTRDISESKRKEYALKASEERFSRVFQSSPLPMTIRRLDDGRFMDANEAYLRAIGRTLEEIQGRTPVELDTWVNPADYQHFMEEVRRRKTVRNYECQLRTPSGKQVVALLTAEIIEVNGQQCVLVITLDITRRKQAEAEREQLIAQLQEALTKVKLLSGLLPICASCKKIRDDKGYWNQIEDYISKHSEAEFSHSVCPDCLENFYSELLRKKQVKVE